MQKNRLLTIILLMVISLPIIIACGSDEESSKIEDGVNVLSGNKLSELRIETENANDLPVVIKAEYDSKGRLKRVFYKEIAWKWDNHGRNSYPYYTGEFVDLIKIDYDNRKVAINTGWKNSTTTTYDLALNDDGYVSKIGLYSWKYNSNGYLVEIDEPRSISKFNYDNNSIDNALISRTMRNETCYLYVSYNNDENTGDLFYKIRRTDVPETNRFEFNYLELATIIVYQSGLFGKVSNIFINLTSKDQLSTLFEFQSDIELKKAKFTFTCK